MILIHGKKYITVAERIQEAGIDFKSLNTEVLSNNPVVIKATVTTERGTFTGISAANPDKTLEKQSPYEIAETSAVGRALGFAGYGIVEGIATADEIAKVDPVDEWQQNAKDIEVDHFCHEHGKQMKERKTPTGGVFYDHRMQIDGVWNMCDGTGYKAQK